MLLFSAVKDKAYDVMLGEILGSGLFHKLSLVRLKTSRGTDALELGRLAQSLAKDIHTKSQITMVEPEEYESVEEALDSILTRKTEDQRIYVAGSLYLVGEVKAYLGVFKHD